MLLRNRRIGARSGPSGSAPMREVPLDGVLSLSLLIIPSVREKAFSRPDQRVATRASSASEWELFPEQRVARTKWKERAASEQMRGMNLRPIGSRPLSFLETRRPLGRSDP